MDECLDIVGGVADASGLCVDSLAMGDDGAAGEGS
jgi:hypothetical protein